MRVNFYATLRQIVGRKTVEFDLSDGSTIQQLVDEILERFPDLRPVMLTAGGDLGGHVHVFINGREARYMEGGMQTVLKPEDVVSIFPPVGGG